MKKPVCILILLLFAALLSYSLGLESFDIKSGMIWIGNAAVDPAGTDAAPSPLTTVVGISLPIRLSNIFLIAPELRYYGVPYGMEYGRAVPVEQEFADWAWVMGLLIEPRAVFDFPIQRWLSLGVYVSPTILVRIPARTWGAADTTAIASYLYDQTRYLYPEVGFYFDWRIPSNKRSIEAESLNEGEFEKPEGEEGIVINLVVDLGAYFPIFHIWDGENAPLWDQFMVSGTIGLKFAIK